MENGAAETKSYRPGVLLGVTALLAVVVLNAVVSMHATRMLLYRRKRSSTPEW